MVSERLELKGYGDIALVRARCLKDKTSGMTLVPFTASEAQLARVVSWESRPENTKYLYRYPGERPVGEEEIAAAFRRKMSRKAYTALYEITRPGGEVVGNVGLQEINLWEPERSAFARVMIDRQFQGVGYATRAIEMLLAYAKSIRLKTVFAEVHWDNVGSIEVFRRFAKSVDKEPGNIPWVRFTIPLAFYQPPDNLALDVA